MQHVGGPVTIAILIGFVVGEPPGVFSISWLAVRSGIAKRPPELSRTLLAGGGLLAGIGLTMALLIANLAFSESLINGAKIGILLASGLSAVAGLALLTWAATSRRTAPEP